MCLTAFIVCGVWIFYYTHAASLRLTSLSATSCRHFTSWSLRHANQSCSSHVSDTCVMGVRCKTPWHQMNRMESFAFWNKGNWNINVSVFVPQMRVCYIARVCLQMSWVPLSGIFILMFCQFDIVLLQSAVHNIGGLIAKEKVGGGSSLAWERSYIIAVISELGSQTEGAFEWSSWDNQH